MTYCLFREKSSVDNGVKISSKIIRNNKDKIYQIYKKARERWLYVRNAAGYLRKHCRKLKIIKRALLKLQKTYKNFQEIPSEVWADKKKGKKNENTSDPFWYLLIFYMYHEELKNLENFTIKLITSMNYFDGNGRKYVLAYCSQTPFYIRLSTRIQFPTFSNDILHVLLKLLLIISILTMM